jgi:hypothetical protein
MAKVAKVTVRWTKRELDTVAAILNDHPIFPGRKAALDAVAQALRTENAARSAGKKRKFGRLPVLSFTPAVADRLINILDRSGIVVARRAGGQLDKQRRRAALRGRASGPNPHADSRSKRVKRGDSGHFR